MYEIEKEITELIKQSSDELTKPMTAFITFNLELGKNKVITKWLNGEGILGNYHPEFQRATEPTNIIWENRYIRGAEFRRRKCFRGI